MPPPKTGKTIQSVQRAIDILNCFDDMDTELSLGQISAMLQLNKSTVHGILNTLSQNDFIRQNSSSHYMLGSYFLHKCNTAQTSLYSLLKDQSLDGMTALSNRYGVSCGLFKLELGELIRVNWVQPQNQNFAIVSYATHIHPLHCSASGKLLLAHMEPQQLDKYLHENPLSAYTPKTITQRESLFQALEMIRQEGFAVENEELALDVYALSVPIYNKKGQLFATIGATDTVSYLRPQKQEVVTALKNLAQNISHRLFY